MNDEESPLDLAFVEGSVGSDKEENELRRIRERTALLVACGSCACFGGIAGMDARMSRKGLVQTVYGGDGARFDAHAHRPLSDFVKVDYPLVGCPIEKDEFVAAVSSLLHGDVPLPPSTPVCHECKMLEQECLLITKGLPCAGPVSASGCGARCPGFNVPCIGCRGPVVEANLESLREILVEKGLSDEAIRDKLRTFAAPVIAWQRPEGAA